MAKTDLTLARVRELIHYNPTTGAFTWRSGMNAGKPAGYVDPRGYIAISIGARNNRTRVYGHQIAVLYMTGEWPAADVDHRNLIKSDNRWSNLRAVTRVVNKQNRIDAMPNSKLGLLGVFERSRKPGRFIATIKVDGKIRQIGTFDTPEAAHAAYTDAKRRLHPGCTL